MLFTGKTRTKNIYKRFSKMDIILNIMDLLPIKWERKSDQRCIETDGNYPMQERFGWRKQGLVFHFTLRVLWVF